MKNYYYKKPSKLITYLDMNNLHGWEMNSYLPYGGFKWLKNVDGFDVNSISKKSPIRHIFKVDLEYPDELHVLHNNYPLAPEKLKYTSTPTHITRNIFGKNYAAIHEIKPVLLLNKPIYVGFSVLELSKWLMYDFHYSFIKKHFDAELLFTDTDSLTYEIKSEDVYEEFFKHKHLFDFSNYPKDSNFFDQADKKVIGKMKDKSEGKIIDEFN